MKIKFFKTKKDFRKKTAIVNPNLYWNIILYVTFALIILSFVFGLWFFSKTSTEPPVSAVDINGQIGVVKKQRIQKVLEYFSEREQKSAEILNSPSPVVDPSL